jgi:hypothetical protein
MIQIILLILGIVYAFRKPKLKALTASQFPGVSAEAFAEWQTQEMKSINMFLWASWGFFVVSIPAQLLLVAAFPDGAIGIQVLFFALFLIMLVMAAIPGSKAAKLKKQCGIKWP